jgi:hypothetical protein
LAQALIHGTPAEQQRAHRLIREARTELASAEDSPYARDVRAALARWKPSSSKR